MESWPDYTPTQGGLQGKFSFVEYNNKKSKLRKVLNGGFQSGIIANALQNLNEQAASNPKDINFTSYAGIIFFKFEL